jgi:hypothetical protein
MRQTAPLLLSILLISCSGPSGSGDGDGGAGGDGGVANGDGGTLGDDAGSVSCTPGARSCRGSSYERECVEVNGQTQWVETACSTYNYCLTDRCEPGCLDECALGETRTTGGTNQVCGLYSADTGGFVSTGSGGHDLARKHLGWIRQHQLANGYIANTVFSDASHQTPIAYTGTVDAAEWTGVYLAAESLRSMSTGSPDAARNVDAIIERFHQLFEVTGTPGYMARIWAPLDGDPLLAALYDAQDWSHAQTTYGGGPAFYHAWTSRDMYAGMILGLGLAYDATTSPTHREMIRDVVVTLARELIRQRTNVPVRIRYQLFGSWQESDLEFDMQHVILVPREMVDGRVFIQIGSDADPSNYDASELRGAREFLPDFQPVLSQTPGLGTLLPSIPRPSTAMMLAAFMEVALHVTTGIPGRQADRAAIAAHYEANKQAWLGLMKQYEYHNQEECWKQYFGMTIAYHPIYTVLRLTEDAAYRSQIQTQVLGDRMRPFSVGHANAYFDYIAGSQGSAGAIPMSEIADTGDQLVDFTPPPKAAITVNNTGAYQANPSCPNQANAPVAIGDRVPVDFMWQHHPFRLVNDQVDPRHVYPGTDYLVAYWMGRQHGFLTDDAPNTCTRWTTQ